MASSMFVKVTCLAMICLVLGIPLANAAPSCPEVQQTLAPCVPYVTHPGPPISPPPPCCNAVKTLNGQSKTTQDRRDVCGCLKSMMGGIPGLNLPAIASLPKDCGVDIGYIISPNMDCNKVN
ncbi:putative plant lipid transfer protein/Par allergen [Medicago truncatula]|uniref:Non-specific lipid-transfer protein n=1 Tax=Medicago truncatula TaxID=3880 RepID=A0A396H2G3_MEDTR|nr:non-specific lipid-transfer protein [Medicago truncatula]RHN46671.1 putative plant lipid transfer protein/Par allergen [Medicago truncatula]